MKRMYWMLLIWIIGTGSAIRAQNLPSYRKMSAHKKVMFKRIMDLDERQMEKFWPIYEEMDRNLRKLAVEKKKIILDIRQNMQTKGKEAELERLLDRYMAIEKERVEIKERYYQKFKEILPIRTVVRIPLAERQFRKRMVDRLRQRRREPLRQMQRHPTAPR